MSTLPPPVPAPPAPLRNTTYAVASLVCGLVWTAGVTSVLAIVFATKQFNRDAAGGHPRSGLAVAGLVLGIITAVTSAFFWLNVILGG